MAFIIRSIHLFSAKICCGSSATNEDSKLEPTGFFSRTSVAGSFQVSGVDMAGPDIYPPGTVKDLSLGVLIGKLQMTFTAPGDDLDEGIGNI